jgi:hypothetical protein
MEVQEAWDAMDPEMQDGFKDIAAAQKRIEIKRRVASRRHPVGKSLGQIPVYRQQR